jgi:hypothetical protein
VIEVRKYRHFALYAGERLLAVCLYRVGALEVKRRVEDLEAQLHDTTARCASEPSLIADAIAVRDDQR